jgi:glyoxylase-like metal-dependent hydrolase (beta-lactamase superfamily II)
MNDSRNDIHSFTIGRFHCAVIDDGFTEYATADLLFGSAPEKELGEKLISYGLVPDRIKCFSNCLLVNNSGELILVDAGFGQVSAEYPGAENAGMLAENLNKNGYNPDDIKKVIFTHYHTDHIGGGLDHKGNPAFPNAAFFMNIKDWRQGTSIESYGKKVLLALEDRMEFFEGEIDLCPGIKAIPAPGHTPGHTVIRIESDNREFLNISDLAAHQIHFENPEWSMAHEYDLDLAARTRREIFAYAADKNIPLLTYHMPFPGLGCLYKKNEGWIWQALEQ